MIHRAFVQLLRPGIIVLSEDESKHVQNVLRMNVGDSIDVFDEPGNTARARISRLSKQGVELEVSDVVAPTKARELTVCSAVAKGERADWVIEKLSELGVRRFVPIVTRRSVVEPRSGKQERWKRIAIEAAKQSGRVGVMSISPPTPLQMVRIERQCAVLSSERETDIPGPIEWSTLTQIFIGPEGGWEEEELQWLEGKGGRRVRLPTPILRIETACIVAAALCLCHIPANQ